MIIHYGLYTKNIIKMDGIRYTWVVQCGEETGTATGEFDKVTCDACILVRFQNEAEKSLTTTT
jgi:hypothetical protein